MRISLVGDNLIATCNLLKLASERTTHAHRALRFDRPHLAIEESIPGVVDTITAHSGKPGLRYLDYRGQLVNA
jgi:hypothetical protein